MQSSKQGYQDTNAIDSHLSAQTYRSCLTQQKGLEQGTTPIQPFLLSPYGSIPHTS